MLLMSTCMVQEGRVPAEQRVLLESALKTAARDHVGSTTRLAVAWVTVPSGSGYSAGKPSTSSLVQLGVPDGFAQASREALMRDVNDRWCMITGQTPYEVMVSATDQTAGRKLLKGILQQVPLSQKPRVLANHLVQSIRSLAVRP